MSVHVDNFQEIRVSIDFTYKENELLIHLLGDVVAQWLGRRTWDLKVESSSPGWCTHVVFLGKTLTVPLSTQVYKTRLMSRLYDCGADFTYLPLAIPIYIHLLRLKGSNCQFRSLAFFSWRVIL